MRKERIGYTIVSSTPIGDGWCKVVAINKYNTAQEYMMKMWDMVKVGSSEFTAKERNATTTTGNGHIMVDGEYYQLHRNYTALEEPIIL